MTIYALSTDIYTQGEKGQDGHFGSNPGAAGGQGLRGEATAAGTARAQRDPSPSRPRGSAIACCGGDPARLRRVV